MIDLEATVGTERGSRFDVFAALLIGLVAVSASLLAIVQVDRSATETRAQLLAARHASEATSVAAASGALFGLRAQSLQAATAIGIEGLSRQIVALGTGDARESARGAADFNASQRLLAIADLMTQVPPEDGPLDAYARSLLASTNADAHRLTGEQIAQVKLAEDASRQGSRAMVGLSLIALAGVLAGLAAILGDGRAGRATLLAGYVVAGLAVAAGLTALV